MAHHLYVCPKYSKELKKHILFRNYLRSHEEDMKKYAETKLKGDWFMLDSFIIRNVHINDFIDISKIRKMPGVIEYILALDSESPEK